jgi:hypothetical protein
MSSANAAAKKRRAPASVQESVPRPGMSQSGQPSPNMNQVGLTLPQVIALVDSRLIRLETFVSESKNESGSANVLSQDSESFMESETVKSFMSDFNAKFDALAEEIANMKNIVLSLQSYTMDVNKVLMDERIRILSEVGDSNQDEENDTENVEELENS